MKTNVRKLAFAAILAAVAFALSGFSIPVGASRCFPIQHAVNVIGGIFLGPFYATGAAFVTSLLRVICGTGTLLAFPGSMVGAFLCGLLYKKFPYLLSAFAGEVFGTGVLGGLLSYPIAYLIMGNKEAAVFGYVVPFLIASCVGAAISVVIVFALKRTGVLKMLQHSMQ